MRCIFIEETPTIFERRVWDRRACAPPPAEVSSCALPGRRGECGAVRSRLQDSSTPFQHENNTYFDPYQRLLRDNIQCWLCRVRTAHLCLSLWLCLIKIAGRSAVGRLAVIFAPPFLGVSKWRTRPFENASASVFFSFSRGFIYNSTGVCCVNVIAINIRNHPAQVCSFSEVNVVGDSTRRFINVMLASNSWLTPVSTHTSVLSSLNVKFNVDLAVCSSVWVNTEILDHSKCRFCCIPVENKGDEGCVVKPSELPTQTAYLGVSYDR